MSNTQRYQNTKKNKTPKLDILLNSYQSLKLILSPNLPKKKATFMNLLLELITSQLKLYIELLNTKEIRKIYEFLDSNHQKLSESITSLYSLSSNTEKYKEKEKEKEISRLTPKKKEPEKESPLSKSDSKASIEIFLNKSNQKEISEHNNTVTSKISEENKKATTNQEKINKKEKIIEWGKVKEKEIKIRQRKLFERAKSINKSSSNKKLITKIYPNPKYKFRSKEKIIKQNKPKQEYKPKKIEPKRQNLIKQENSLNKTENLPQKKLKVKKLDQNSNTIVKPKSPEHYNYISTCPPIYNVIGNNKIFTNLNNSNDNNNKLEDKYVSIKLTSRLMERLNNKKNQNNNTLNKRVQNSDIIEEEDSNDIVNYTKKDKNIKEKNTRKNNDNNDIITLDDFLVPYNKNNNGEKLYLTKTGQGIITEKQKDLLENYLNNCLFDEEVESDIQFSYFPNVKKNNNKNKQNLNLTSSYSSGDISNLKEGSLLKSVTSKKSKNEDEELKNVINLLPNNLEGSLDWYLRKKKASMFDRSIFKICHDVIDNYKKLEAKEERSKSKSRFNIRSDRKKMTVNTVFGVNKLRELNKKLRLIKSRDDDSVGKSMLHLSFG